MIEVSDSKKDSKLPPPDDFSKTTPNVNLPKQERTPDDLEKTNYGYAPQPPGEDWGKTVANYDTTSADADEPDFDKTYLPRNQPNKEDDWAMTRANIEIPADFGNQPEDFTEYGSSEKEQNFDLTTPLIRLPEAERAKYQKLPPTPAQETARKKEEEKNKGGIPAWFWVSGTLMAVFFFAVVALLVIYFVTRGSKSFEVVLTDAPIGSDVYIDGTRWGVTTEDGSINLPILKAGETRKIEIKHPSYACDAVEIESDESTDGKTIKKKARCETVKTGEDCTNIKAGEVEKSERCALEILGKLSDPPSIDDLLKALNMQIINFESGSFSIPPQRLEFLKRAAGFINKLPPSVVIEVGGHTDDIGSDVNNQKLSENRAEAVKNALVKFAVNADRLQVKGYGKDKPKVPNTDTESRAKNRRIEYTAVKR